MDELAAEGVRIVDVRTVGEFEMGHIAGAENVPISGFEGAAGTWDTAQPIAVYCTTGERSITAVQLLQSMGFETVYHFNEGLVAYAGELEGGQTVAQAPIDETLETPVLYEFYTDW
jgi:rhodanese-related sulfurtransferase